jgi:Plasmid pRiA4b ORF-3-like protein
MIDMARKRQTSVAKKTKLIADQAAALAEYAAKALSAAEQLAIKKKVVVGFPLNEAEKIFAAELPGLSATLKMKLAKKNATFTVADTASIVMAVADSLLEGEPLKRLALLVTAKKLIDCLEHNVVKPTFPTKAKRSKPADIVYQFKITLLESHPPIWRRIQVKDCTLDKLHEHIQTAMGWTNSHLHHFKVREQLYGDPMLMAENMEEMDYMDSTTTKISEILPATGKRFRFRYEYDSGDSWYHEVLFEGIVRLDSKAKYPLCLEGARACPPEDCGGIWGYADFVEAIQNPDHEQHEKMLEWVGGRFDPDDFDPAAATKNMKKGLPDWRRMV